MLLVVLLCGCDDETHVEACAPEPVDYYDVAIESVDVAVAHYATATLHDGSEYYVYNYEYLVTLANVGSTPVSRHLTVSVDIPYQFQENVFDGFAYRTSRELLVHLAPGERQVYAISGDRTAGYGAEPPAQPGPYLMTAIEGLQLDQFYSSEGNQVVGRDADIDNNLVVTPIDILPSPPESAL